MKNDEKIEKQGDTTTTICMNKDRKKKRLITKKKNKHQHQQKEAQGDYTLYLYNNEKKLHHILYSNSVECPICFLVSKKKMLSLFLLCNFIYLFTHL